MRKTLRNKLLLVGVTLATLFTIAGCQVTQSLDEFREENNLPAQVTYYANGGLFENNTDQKDLYYTAGDKAADIGNVSFTSGSISISRDDYEFLGWYYVELDEKGEPILDENGNLVLGEEVDFSKALENSDHWKVAAAWTALSKVKVQLVCDDTATLTVSDTLSYQNGDVIKEYSFNSTGIVQSTTSAPIKVANNAYSFVEFYADESCTTQVEWPIQKGEADIIIYAKYIEGNWKMLKEADDVKDMFADTALSTNRYYLVNDIDCSVLSKAISSVTKFNCELQGNGHTISNLSIQKTKLSNASKVSFLGELGEAAVIENVTFDNITARFETIPNAFIETYFVFTSKAETAKISNVAISGSMEVVLASGASIANIPMSETGYAMDNWQFGGFEKDEDFTGITVSAELIIN